MKKQIFTSLQALMPFMTQVKKVYVISGNVAIETNFGSVARSLNFDAYSYEIEYDEETLQHKVFKINSITTVHKRKESE